MQHTSPRRRGRDEDANGVAGPSNGGDGGAMDVDQDHVDGGEEGDEALTTVTPSRVRQRSCPPLPVLTARPAPAPLIFACAFSAFSSLFSFAYVVLVG